MLQQTTCLDRLREKWKVVDPINYIRQNVEHDLMINARYDTTIPPVYSKKLWEALDRPAIRWLKADHWTSGFFMPFMVRQTKDFFSGNPAISPAGVFRERGRAWGIGGNMVSCSGQCYSVIIGCI